MKSSLLCNLGRGKIFPNNIYRANYHFTHSKKTKKTIIPPYYRWVVLCTVKDPVCCLCLLGRPVIDGVGVLATSINLQVDFRHDGEVCGEQYYCLCDVSTGVLRDILW
jgi:hypothetical protein